MRITAILGFLLLFLVGCEYQTAAERAPGKVYPSSAFVQHFGEPPVPQEGFAYARVGYLPMVEPTGQVSPIPLFLFSEGQHLDRILGQLFSEKLLVSKRSKLSLPYAKGVRLTQLDQAGDTLTVSLQTETELAAADRLGIDRAVTETAAQFEEISRVRVLYDGVVSPDQPIEGYRQRPEMIAAVEKPMLLDVVGFWEPGAAGPEEILINFDRPVSINSFRLLDKSGQQVGGKYYTSIFNMAVSVHPSQPEKFKAGMELNVSWDVIDALGRRNSALDTMTLARQEH